MNYKTFLFVGLTGYKFKEGFAFSETGRIVPHRKLEFKLVI